MAANTIGLKIHTPEDFNKGVKDLMVHMSVLDAILAYCENNNKNLSSLTLKELQKFSKVIKNDVFNFLSIEKSVSSKKSYGGTSTSNVKNMINRYKKMLSKSKN